MAETAVILLQFSLPFIFIYVCNLKKIARDLAMNNVIAVMQLGSRKKGLSQRSWTQHDPQDILNL